MWLRRHKVLTVLGGLAALILLVVVINLATGHPAAKPSAPVAQSYPSVTSLLAAMATHGAVCSGVSLSYGGNVSGEVNPFAECSGGSNGDTAVLVFTSHASALAYAQDMLGMNVGPAAEVVGPDWTVNTSPAFAPKVVKAVGGQLLSAPASTPAKSAPAASAPAAPATTAAPVMTKQTDKIEFRVWGTGEPSIQYGSDSSTNNPNDGAGPLGDGNYLPWSATVAYDPAALYYAVSAQLEGSGDISDSVTEVVTTWCSGQAAKTESFPLANGSANGGYGIAQAEYTGGDTGNAQQAESDAGC